MNVTSGDDSEAKTFNWPLLFILPVIIFGIGGNILVCMAVSMEKRLQSVTNYFLLSLAITDLLVCLVVWPFSMLHELMGQWPLNHILCDIYITSDVLMCTSSILHLCTISLERYFAIRNPLTTRTRSKRAVRIKIFLVWATSLAISSPIMILGFVDETNILNENQCVLRNKDFIIYGSVSAFFIPLGIMGILFGFTIHLLRSQWKMCDSKLGKSGVLSMRRFQSRQAMSVKEGKKKGQKALARRTKSYPEPRNGVVKQSGQDDTVFDDGKGPEQSARPSDSNISTIYDESDLNTSTPPTSPTLSQSSSDFKISFQQFRAQSATISETDEEMTVSQKYAVSTETTLTQLPSSIERIPDASGLDSDQTSVCNNRHSYANDSSPSDDKPKDMQKTFSAPSRLHELIKRGQGSGSRPSTPTNMSKKDSVRQKQVKNTVKNEQKASKTLFILFITFVICWAPFFAVNVLTALCTDCELNHVMVTTFVWLGYVSSTLNPIIYTVFNKTFRTTFIKLMKCEYRTIQKPVRIETLSSGLHAKHQRNMASIPL